MKLQDQDMIKRFIFIKSWVYALPFLHDSMAFHYLIMDSRNSLGVSIIAD